MKLRILVVEDHDSAFLAIKTLLSVLYPDAEIVRKMHERDAIELINGELSFDIVISDLDNPVKDGGVRVIKALKARHPEIPAILTTGGRTDEELARLAAECGADSFFPKPFTMHQFKTQLDNCIAKIAITA